MLVPENRVPGNQGSVPSLTSPAALKRLLAQKGLAPRRHLGQNFLIDPGVLAKIVTAADLGAQDLAMEIGPGLGVLTQALAQRAGRVLAIELDPGMVALLGESLQGRPNVEIVQGDALRLDLQSLLDERQPPTAGKVKVVANLPYYITTPLLMRLLEEVSGWERAVLMVQREVADRLLAAPGSKAYGALSLAVRYYAEAELVTPVGSRSFWPAPDVESAVVRLWRRETPIVAAPKELLFAAVRAGFGQRRKTLGNALASRWGRDAALASLGAAGIDPQRRGETLSLAEYAILAEALSRLT
ncbi:MAG: 16S rRNA (adenine(1518)-N(6)/adenine(1519)-N(6))-dimethyltransferase RsmA [Symbiobacteriia bacterium]